MAAIAGGLRPCRSESRSFRVGHALLIPQLRPGRMRRRSTPMRWKRSWVTNMLRASSNKSIGGLRKRGLRVKRIALAAVILISTSLTGQIGQEPTPGTTQTTPAAAAGATSSAPPEATSSAPSAAAVQQRVLKYDPSRAAQEQASQPQQKVGENDPSTLHLL